MARLRLFANLREAAGTGDAEIHGGTVAEVLDAATDRFGDRFSAGLGAAQVWVNGEQAGPSTPVGATDEVALIPPVSGGQLTFQTATLYHLAVGAALATALLLANYVSLQVFVFVAVAAVMAWVWDVTEVSVARGVPLNVFPPMLAIAIAGNAAYRWGYEGFAIATGAAVGAALIWAVFDPKRRTLQGTIVTSLVGIVAAMAAGALVLVRMRTVEETTAVILLLAAGALAGWAALRFGESMGWLDFNIGSFAGLLVAAVVLGLIAETLDLTAMLLGAVGGTAGMIGGRALGSMLRSGEILHTAQPPGLLVLFDGPVLAAGMLWIVFIVFG
jgi:molybdopterin converting factor small subunit